MRTSPSGLELAAPPGKFRVVGVDTFTRDIDNDWVIGDFDKLSLAIFAARGAGKEMCKTHVYDDQGRHLFDAGTF